MSAIRVKYQHETEKELSEILGMSIDEFMSILDNIDDTVQRESEILLGTDELAHIDEQIERERR